MQQPASYDLIMYQGASWDYQFTWSVSGSPVNLTGYTARMQVRPSYISDSVILSLTNGSGITLGGAAGTIALAASASVSAAIEPRAYVYDLELVNGSEVTRLLEGKFTATPEVTR